MLNDSFLQAKDTVNFGCVNQDLTWVIFNKANKEKGPVVACTVQDFIKAYPGIIPLANPNDYKILQNEKPASAFSQAAWNVLKIFLAF